EVETPTETPEVEKVIETPEVETPTETPEVEKVIETPTETPEVKTVESTVDAKLDDSEPIEE
ncbi:MAG: DNA repair and recombination protein RadA, partial [Nitrosopumilus sp.]